MFDLQLSARHCAPVQDIIHSNAFFTLSGGITREFVTFFHPDYAFFLVGDLHVYGAAHLEPGTLAAGIYRGDITAKDYFGAFFWLLLDNRSGAVSLMCDPFGQCPVCCIQTAPGRYRFVSQARISRVGMCRHRVSDDFVARFMQHGVRGATCTALDGVSLLEPGFRYRLDAALRLTSDYVMDEVLESTPFSSPYDALSYTLDCKLQHHDELVIELSGGVESSSVAAVVSRYKREKRIRCVTYYDARCCASNEVECARAVAVFFGLPHEVIDLAAISPFSPSPQPMALHLMPSVYSCQYAQSRQVVERYDEQTLFISGHGGDALFLAPPPPRLMIDALVQSGIKQALRVWYSVAIQRRTPLLTTLFQAFGTRELRTPQEDDLYVRSERCTRRPTLRQVWQELRWTVLEVAPLLNPNYTGKRTYFPFLTAPVVIHALQGPLASLVHNEFNRFSLRESVYRHTRCPALWRTDKGDTTHNMLAGLAKNRDHVADFLLQGQLMSRGFLQQQAVINDLNALRMGHDERLAGIVRAFAAEAMLRTLC